MKETSLITLTPERQENLLVDDVLRQDAEAVHRLGAAVWSDKLEVAAHPVK
jgi:hypothetical protein